MEKFLEFLKAKFCKPLIKIDNSGLYMPGEWDKPQK